MKEKIEKGCIGTSFDDFLREQGIYEETTERAIKRVLAWQLAEAMKERGLSKVQMAKQIQTDRAQIDGLFDPQDDSLTLMTLVKAASAVGRTLRIDLVEDRSQ